MKYEDKKKFIINIVFIICAFAVAYFVFKYVIRWVLPFIVGFTIAFLLKPITEAITKFTHIKRKGVSLFVIGIFYSLIFTIIWILTAFLWNQISVLIKAMPSIYFTKLEPLLWSLNNWIIQNAKMLSPEFANTLSDMISGLLQQLASIVKNLSLVLVTYIKNIVASFPIYLISIIFTIVCSVFISVDYNNVTSFLKRQLSDKLNSNLTQSRSFLSNTLLKMIKAYIIILSITFIELLIGLSVLKVKYALPIAALVAFLDIMPLVGTGGILIPWAIIELFLKNYNLGIGLLVIYAVITIVRNIIEPRIIGHQIGLHPVITITAMYAGLRIFGFIGFISAPIIAILIKYLNDTNKIHLYK